MSTKEEARNGDRHGNVGLISYLANLEIEDTGLCLERLGLRGSDLTKAISVLKERHAEEQRILRRAYQMS